MEGETADGKNAGTPERSAVDERQYNECELKQQSIIVPQCGTTKRGRYGQNEISGSGIFEI